MLIGVCIAPLLALLVISAHDIWIAKVAAEREEIGAEYVAPLYNVFRLTQRHRGLSHGYRAGLSELKDRLDLVATNCPRPSLSSTPSTKNTQRYWA
ncbi:MAG: hypothetical protein U1F34_01235 [Gammaproteobacteria bacterium]